MVTISSTRGDAKTKRRYRVVARFLRDIPDGEWWVIGFDGSPYSHDTWWLSTRRFVDGQPTEAVVNRGWRPVAITGPITFQEVREHRPNEYTLAPIDPDGDYANSLRAKLWREWVP